MVRRKERQAGKAVADVDVVREEMRFIKRRISPQQTFRTKEDPKGEAAGGGYRSPFIGR